MVVCVIFLSEHLKDFMQFLLAVLELLIISHELHQQINFEIALYVATKQIMLYKKHILAFRTENVFFQLCEMQTLHHCPGVFDPK